MERTLPLLPSSLAGTPAVIGATSSCFGYGPSDATVSADAVLSSDVSRALHMRQSTLGGVQVS